MTCKVIGHRGFKAKYPENTLSGFERCYTAGASTIETDLWATSDNVLVVSHDVNTARVFCSQNGEKTQFNILETPFSQVKSLKTIQSGEPLLTFRDLLVWFRDFATGRFSECKIMLDLKNSNPPELLRLLVQDVLSVSPDLSWWIPRLQIGIWNIRFLKYLNQDPFFQTLGNSTDGFFDIYHISLSWKDTLTYLSYEKFVKALDQKRRFCISGVSIIYVSTWSKECLETFLPAVKAHNLALVNWTINTKWQLSYFVDMCRFYGLREYGVIADDPAQMLQYINEAECTGQFPWLPWKFRVVHWFIQTIARMSPKSPLISRASFDTWVDPQERLPSRPKLGNKIFALLQKLGIF